MSRTLSRLLFVSLFVFAGALLINPSPGSRSTAGNSAPPQGLKVVEVTFDGLMIFTEVKGHGTDRFEVGILDPSIAHGHKFEIIQTSPEQQPSPIPVSLPTTNNWVLRVESEDGLIRPVDISVLGGLNGCRNRLDETKNEFWNVGHAFAFCWIIDLEKEFLGGREFTLQRGKLKPIIELYNGELLTKYKYDEVVRRSRPRNTKRDYGFVADTVALKVELNPKEKLVMLIPGIKKPLFTLTKHGESVQIMNIGKEKTNQQGDGICKNGVDSHFVSYYKLLNAQRPPLHDDICRPENARRPINRYHRVRATSSRPAARQGMLSFGPYACGTGFLGISKKPLK